MIQAPPVTDDIHELRSWCFKLWRWLQNPDKLLVNYIEMMEQTADIAAPTADRCVIYCKDNGSTKTELVVRFPTGAVQVPAIEP
jgi:hypothetical protein